MLAALEGRHVYNNSRTKLIIFILYLETTNISTWGTHFRLLRENYGSYHIFLDLFVGILIVCRIFLYGFSARTVVNIMRLHRSNTSLQVSDTLIMIIL